MLKQALLGADVEAPAAKKKRPWYGQKPAACCRHLSGCCSPSRPKPVEAPAGWRRRRLPRQLMKAACHLVACSYMHLAARANERMSSSTGRACQPEAGVQAGVRMRARRYQLMFTAVLYVWPTTPWLQLRAGVCVLAVATMRPAQPSRAHPVQVRPRQALPHPLALQGWGWRACGRGDFLLVLCFTA